MTSNFRVHYIADVQGFKDGENNFIIKELALAAEEFTIVFSIKPPFPYSRLSDKERRQVSWIENKYGFSWSDGYIDYREFKRVIIPYLENKKILVKGLEKVRWIKELCSNCFVTDIDEKECPNLSVMYKIFFDDRSKNNCLSYTKHYSLNNVICIKKWYMKNKMHIFLKL